MNEQQWSTDLLLLIIGQPGKKEKKKTEQNLLNLQGILVLCNSQYCCFECAEERKSRDGCWRSDSEVAVIFVTGGQSAAFGL